MIPNIGIMIGGYIIFRCVEIMCRADVSFGSRGQKHLVMVMGVIGILVTGFLMVDLISTSATSVNQLTR